MMSFGNCSCAFTSKTTTSNILQNDIKPSVKEITVSKFLSKPTKSTHCQKFCV